LTIDLADYDPPEALDDLEDPRSIARGTADIVAGNYKGEEWYVKKTVETAEIEANKAAHIVSQYSDVEAPPAYELENGDLAVKSIGNTRDPFYKDDRLPDINPNNVVESLFEAGAHKAITGDCDVEGNIVFSDRKQGFTAFDYDGAGQALDRSIPTASKFVSKASNALGLKTDRKSAEGALEKMCGRIADGADIQAISEALSGRGEPCNQIVRNLYEAADGY
jgi:hypothetical protein